MDYVNYHGFEIPVMTSTNPNPYYNLDDRHKYRGREPFSHGLRFDRERKSCKSESFAFGTPFEDSGIERIPKKFWKEEIERQTRRRAGLLDVWLDCEIRTKNQNGIPYCWVYGATTAVELARCAQGLPWVELSPESIGAPVTGGVSRGGWANEAFEMAQHEGFLPQDRWRPHDLNYRKYDTPENREERKKYTVPEWLDIPQGDMEAMVSLLLRNVPCGMGLEWWGHLICNVQVLWSDRYGLLFPIINSHSESFGNRGVVAMTEKVAYHWGGSAVRLAA